MRIVFRAEAAADLRSIIAYYQEVAPKALANILSDIHRSIDQLAHFPRIGMPVRDRSFRRVVTRRYHFKVAYRVGEDVVEILGIFRHHDREV
jgi:plasmid stabilization system protein ParE